jgi:hypothetical protein
MIDYLVIALIAATVALAGLGLATTAAGRPLGRVHLVAVGVVEALVVLQAVLAALAVFRGARPAETTTFLIYLVVAVCVLPFALQFARAEPNRWGGTVVAVAAIAVGVAVLRLQALWGTVGG